MVIVMMMVMMMAVTVVVVVVKMVMMVVVVVMMVMMPGKDLSKNRLVEVPMELCHFVSLEILNLYHNCIRVIPEAIINLQMLTYLNLSRNQLSSLPACLCGLPLKVLIASNNKLGSLPEEIGQLKQLMELDVSCNEITALPQQIGQLKSLRELNVRRNYLKVLPQELVDLPLVKFDFSCNKVLVIPICFREMKQLQVLLLENNPLQSPPAQICTKGKVHIFKYLSIQACQIKTADSLYLHTMERPHLHQHVEDGKKDSDSGVGSDNGDKRLSATEERAETCEELLRIEEDAHWHPEGILSSSKDQDVNIAMIEQLRDAVDLLQDPNRRAVCEVDVREDSPAISPTNTSTALFGLKPRSVFLRPQRNLESIDPQFTIRRKMEQMREEKEVVEQLRESIEMRLKVSLHEDLGAALMDGVVLCHLVNHIRPRSVASIHVPSPAVEFSVSENCFLTAADLCSPYDILQLDFRHIRKTVDTLLALGEKPPQPTSALRSRDLISFCLVHILFIVLIYITYRWNALSA
ncbi:Leucine-rich repeat and calponin homology domain-containing protein 1 [Camelus dromedarius]|uniref:Leucine-rich repeat and calponin homology domain-containing protein 1 n=1 Tax=Camelus dromedarius TaxID=9838 RepID=A0A5N4D8T1_CAMDR|nr:Leucine-rich repeat and calponin homology domain-containing protein 1 [Camelus dromedarius]